MKLKREALLFLSIAGLMVSCNGNKNQQSIQPTIVNVAVATNTETDAPKEFSFISKPFRSSELSFRVGGPIDRFEVYAGNYYRQGDIIAEIDSRDFRIRKERTEGIYKQTKAEYERIKILYDKNNISASLYEKAHADYIAAKAAFDASTNELNDTKLIAPFNGYIGEVLIEKYQDVKATQPVITLVDIDQLKIEAYVSQEIAICAKDITNVNVRFDAIPERSFDAKVVETSKSATKNNLSYLLTAILPNPERELLAGMSGKLSFDVKGSSTKLTIPQSAVCHNPTDGDFVWTVNTQTQKVSKRKIGIGSILSNGIITVNSGLQENEVVAISGLRFLSEGMNITTGNRVALK